MTDSPMPVRSSTESPVIGGPVYGGARVVLPDVPGLGIDGMRSGDG